MATKHVCDRCHGEVSHPSELIVLELHNAPGAVTRQANENFCRRELCPNCAADVQRFANEPPRKTIEKPKLHEGALVLVEGIVVAAGAPHAKTYQIEIAGTNGKCCHDVPSEHIHKVYDQHGTQSKQNQENTNERT